MAKIEKLRTEHLTLNRISLADLEVIRELHSNPDVMATLGGVRSAQETQAALQGLSVHWEHHSFGPWVAPDAVTGTFIGMGGLRRVTIEQHEEVEIGYALMPEFWSRGLATELARVSAQVGFIALSLPELVSFTLPTNIRSRRVMEKVGFRFERDFTYKGYPQVLYRQTIAMWGANSSS